MKKISSFSYKDLLSLQEDTLVEKVYCLPVFGEDFSQKEIDNIDTEGFIDIGRRNWDWYFTNKTNDNRGEEIKNILFSKNSEDKEGFEFMDYLQQLGVYMFIDINA